MRLCRICGVSLGTQRRHEYICRDCKRLQDAERRARLRAQGRSVSGSDTWDAVKQARWRAAYFAREDVRARQAARQRARHQRPEEQVKYAARYAARNAVRRGNLTRLQCESCGDARSQAHHADYSRPLNVVWLCRPCHTREHRRARGES